LCKREPLILSFIFVFACFWKQKLAHIVYMSVPRARPRAAVFDDAV